MSAAAYRDEIVRRLRWRGLPACPGDNDHTIGITSPAPKVDSDAAIARRNGRKALQAVGAGTVEFCGLAPEGTEHATYYYRVYED